MTKHVYIYINHTTGKTLYIDTCSKCNFLSFPFNNARKLLMFELLKVVPMEVNSQGSWVASVLEGWKRCDFDMFPCCFQIKIIPCKQKTHQTRLNLQMFFFYIFSLELCVEIEHVLFFFVASDFQNALRKRTRHVSPPESKLKQCCNVLTRVLATWTRQVGRWGRVWWGAV